MGLQLLWLLAAYYWFKGQMLHNLVNNLKLFTKNVFLYDGHLPKLFYANFWNNVAKVRDCLANLQTSSRAGRATQRNPSQNTKRKRKQPKTKNPQTIFF